MLQAHRIAEALARRIAPEPLTILGVNAAFRDVLGKDYRFVGALVERLVLALGEQKRVREYRVRRFLMADRGFTNACAKHSFTGLSLVTIVPEDPQMLPSPGSASGWQIPSIVTMGDLGHWLDLDAPHLLWFADARTTEARLPAGPLRHYRYRWVAKRSGGARLIESPKIQLKALQRRILHGILDAIPPHPAAHAFRRGRGTVTFAAPHIGQAMVLRMDLAEFFPSIPRWRVLALFMTAGYPESVAAVLANLCVNTAPGNVLIDCPDSVPTENRWALRKLYQRPHLPQGAPTSPALANLCAYRLDCRLTGLARSCGAEYTRYADDLVCSGGDDFARCCERFYIRAAAIIMEEGFRPNLRKTRFMASSGSQRAAGIVVNEKLNTSRQEFDVLKATLHNCVVHGPSSQNRDVRAEFQAHLAGRIAQMTYVNAQRGIKLQRLFQQIDWGR